MSHNDALERTKNQAKNASTAFGAQGSRRRGDGPAVRTRRGPANHDDESGDESQGEQSSEEEEEEEEEDESE